MLECVVLGVAVQLVVGWITPFTLIFTGLVVGFAARDKKTGAVAGLIVGIIIAIGFMLRTYLSLQISYYYPVSSALNLLGPAGSYIVALIMIVCGLLGGYVGGSMIQGYMEESFRRGESAGAVERTAKRIDARAKENKR